MKTVLCIMSVTACVLFTLALSTASPIGSEETPSATASTGTPTTTSAGTPVSVTWTETSDNISTTPVPKPAVGHLNGSKLVIINVVKTLEFDVALESEEDNSTETSSESSTPFIETDIQVLNPALLEAIVEEEHHLSSTQTSDSIDGTKSADSDDSQGDED